MLNRKLEEWQEYLFFDLQFEDSSRTIKTGEPELFPNICILNYKVQPYDFL